MKVLQINTVYKIKSTGRTCLEVEKALIDAGHDCFTAYGNGPKDMGSYSYQVDRRYEYMFHNIMSRISGLEGYFSYFATKRLIKFIKDYQPDVIHLRNLHGHYLNLPLLFRYLKKAGIPLIQNLHDCWSYTGGCCYYSAQGCYKWISECYKCPKKKQYPQSYFFDWSCKIRRDKEKWYGSLQNLTVVGVSKWISDEAKKSFLKDAREILYIYNWINRDVFHPYIENRQTREKYGIPQDKLVVLGVSSIWAEGSQRYDDFMSLSELLKRDQVIVMVGAASHNLSSEKIIHIPFVDDTSDLAKIYSCADVYVHCSIEDTFGKVIAEAMACGTPAIVYDATACGELIKEGCGYSVEPKDVNQIAFYIDEINRRGKKWYRDNCLKNVEENFDYTKNVKKLIELYENICR